MKRARVMRREALTTASDWTEQHLVVTAPASR